MDGDKTGTLAIIDRIDMACGMFHTIRRCYWICVVWARALVRIRIYTISVALCLCISVWVWVWVDLQWYICDTVKVNTMAAGCFYPHICAKYSDSNFNTSMLILLMPHPTAPTFTRSSVFPTRIYRLVIHSIHSQRSNVVLTLAHHVFRERYALCGGLFSKDSFVWLGAWTLSQPKPLQKINI